MTETPIKTFIADLARPFAIYATAASAAWATVVIAYKVTDGNDGAWALGAIGLTLSAIYAGKVIENYRTAASNAEVEKERAKASPPPAEALKPAAIPDEPAAEDPTLYGGPRA
jgi:hypothetical protein